MLPYWHKKSSEVRMGQRLMPIQCESCGNSYCYLMTRIGKGQAIAPYGVGNHDLQAVAEDRCERNLQERLLDGEEAVPCPRCHWVKEEVIKNYLAAKNLWLTSAAVLLGFLGLVWVLVALAIVLFNPRADRVLGLVALILGGTFCLIIFLGMLYVRNRQRLLISANKEDPNARWLPPGTPPALYCDARTGAWEQSRRPATPSGDQGEWNEFRIGWDSFPSHCCGCLAVPADGTALPLSFCEQIHVQAPFCASCERNDQRRQFQAWAIATCFLLLGGGTLLSYSQMSPIETISFAILILIVGQLAIMVILGQWFAAAKIEVVDFHRAVARVRFRNWESNRALRQHLFEDSCQPIDEAFVESAAQLPWSSLRNE